MTACAASAAVAPNAMRILVDGSKSDEGGVFPLALAVEVSLALAVEVLLVGVVRFPLVGVL